MTFSIAGHCARTGMFGVAITTSSICVGSRCPHARAGVGAVATQNVTDPHLATLVLDRMQEGHDAASAIAKVVAGRENIGYRQLTAVDVKGIQRTLPVTKYSVPTRSKRPHTVWPPAIFCPAKMYRSQ